MAMATRDELQVFGDPKDDVEEEEKPELVDPQDELRETCGVKPNCQALKDRLDECTARVESQSKTTENSSEEVIDFMRYVDHCVAKSLWSKLK